MFFSKKLLPSSPYRRLRDFIEREQLAQRSDQWFEQLWYCDEGQQALFFQVLIALKLIGQQFLTKDNARKLFERRQHLMAYLRAFQQVSDWVLFAAPCHQVTLDIILNSEEHASSMAYVLLKMSVSPDLISFENGKKLIAAIPYLTHISSLFHLFLKTDKEMVDQKNFDLLLRLKEGIFGVFECVSELYRAQPVLVCQKNFEKICAAQQYAPTIAEIFRYLSQDQRDLLQEEDISLMMQRLPELSVLKEAIAMIYQRPVALLTRKNLNKLLTAPNIIACRDEICQQSLAVVLPTTDPQNTHNNSINKSAERSALRLKKRYESALIQRQIRATYREIFAWAKTQQDTAGTAQAVILLWGSGEPVRGQEISLRQLLVLCWVALSDQDRRLCSIEDGRKSLYEGLQEIVHGYGPRQAICLGGQFNKLIEKLVGYHPDAEQQVITYQQASAKFPIIVRECAQEYMKKSREFLCLALEEIGPLWQYIAPIAHQKMFEEFAELYHNDDQHPQLMALMSYGENVPLGISDKNNLGKRKRP